MSNNYGATHFLIGSFTRLWPYLVNYKVLLVVVGEWWKGTH